MLLLHEKYRVESLLGAGAFAEVYRVLHLQLNVPRALKILHKDAAGLSSTEFGDYRARFELEAQLGAQLHHLNVIGVHDFEEENGTLILIMELAPGGSLVERMSRSRSEGRPLEVQEAITIAREIAGGLSVLHAQEAVHRDVKPSNILFDAQGHAKIADLGLAQVPHGGSMRSRLSTALRHPGTPPYMSPEQRDTGDPLQPPSDVYALGCVLFEMLTGRIYYNQRPGTRARALRPGIDSGLDDLLARMLAKDPGGRPWDGAELAESLRQAESDRAEEKPRKQLEEAREDLIRIVISALERESVEAAEAALSQLSNHLGTSRSSDSDYGRLERRLDNLQAELKRREDEHRKEKERAEEAKKQKDREAAVAAQQREREEAERRGLAELKRGFVDIPAGEFMMGASPEDNEAYSYEKPSHRVRISRPFQLGQSPVTQAMWESMMGSNPSRFKGNPKRPVESVSWDDIQGFLKKLNDPRDGFVYRLPTEAEWEYAGRAGTTGSRYGDLHSIAWFDENSGKETHPVGEKLPNRLGLYDMLGNVWEWCSDWYDEKYYGGSPAVDPKGPSSARYRVLRGGSWGVDSRSARLSVRFRFNPDGYDDSLGFRVCREKL